MAVIGLAGAQLPVTSDVDANAHAILRAIDEAVRGQADLLLTPEGSLSGWTASVDMARVCEALEEITERARQAGLALALGTCFVEGDGRVYNQVRVYDRSGAYLGAHCKTLLCGPMIEARAEWEIDQFATAPLRTFELDGVQLGALICNDLWANPTATPMPDPHLSQQLAAMGARIVLVAVNGSRSDTDFAKLEWQYHDANIRLRAIAGKLWMVVADNCHPAELNCSCPSGVVRPDGVWVVKAPPRGEHVFVHTVEY